MLKLQDFAAQCGVTDRQIQRLIKKYSEELKGHYERRGQNGTWIDEEGQKALRSKMKTNPPSVVDDTLLKKIEMLEDRIERKDVIIERMQERETAKDKMIEQLQSEKLLLEEKADERINEAVKNTEDVLKSQHEHDMQLADQREQKLRERLEEVQKQLEEARKPWYKKIFN